MNVLFHRSHDRQRAAPRIICSCCGAQLYGGESYWHFNGLRFCEDCLEELAKTAFAAHHHICGEEWLG